MLTYTALRDKIESNLRDSTNTNFKTPEIDDAILDALREVAQFHPYERMETYTIESRTGTATSTSSGNLVDDNEDQIIIARKLLSSLGYKVISSENGRKAVDYIKKKKVDLVLLDMIMEDDFSGLDTYKEIIKFNPGQKAIIVSGFSETEQVKEAMKLGVGKYIKKPYDVDEIGRAVREELDKKENILK